jgi:hypothetical protein
MATCASRGCASTGGGAHCSEEGCEEGRLSSREEEDEEPEVAEVQSTCSIRTAVPVCSICARLRFWSKHLCGTGENYIAR